MFLRSKKVIGSIGTIGEISSKNPSDSKPKTIKSTTNKHPCTRTNNSKCKKINKTRNEREEEVEIENVDVEDVELITVADIEKLLMESGIPDFHLDEEVQEELINIVNKNVESLMEGACLLAKHRKSTVVGINDASLYFRRNLAYGDVTGHVRTRYKHNVTVAHQQRRRLISKSLRKY